MGTDDRNPYYIFASLIKDGCEWHGDTMSRKYCEILDIPNGVEHQAMQTLALFEEGKDYDLSKDKTQVYIIA